MINNSNTNYIRGWRSHMAAAGRAAGTIEQRIYHIKRLVKSGVDIDTATLEQLTEYLALHPWKPGTLRAAAAAWNLAA